MKHRMQFGVCVSLAMLAGLFLAGCGGSTSSTISAPGQSASVVLADRLTLTLTQDTAQVPVGGAVNFQVNLTNRTSAPITSTYLGLNESHYGLGSIYVDYGTGCVVEDSTGAILGTDGAVSTPPPTLPPSPVTVTLQPGQTLPLAQRYTFTREGTYTARAVLQLPSLASVQTAPLTLTVR